MKAWAKRMIWFFGYSITQSFSDYTYYLTHGFAFHYDYVIALISLLGLILPLIVMKDDKEKKGELK